MAETEISTVWSNLRQDLLGRIIARLPFPADRARFRAVCGAWRSAARKHAHQLPWIVFPDCSFCTVGDDGAFIHHRTLPGVPKNATCLGAAADGWLALDCTEDMFRRTPHWDKFCNDNTFLNPRPDVKHSHAYLLHNPFSGETVPLPELDAIVGHVAETFEIRKVLMRSSSPDDLVAVITNNWNYNVILCHPGKGKCVVPDVRVFDVAFHGDKLYGITPEEELVAFHLAKDEDGRPIVTKYRRVIKQQLADGAEDRWSWMYDDSSVDDSDYYDSDDDDDGEPLSAVSSEEEQESDEDDAPSQEDDSFNGDGMVPDGMEIVQDEEVPYEPKDYIVTTRRLVKSRGDGELLMVKHIRQTPPFTVRYTRKVEFFKADINEGTWVPTVDGAVGKGEALFLSRSFSKYNHAYGDIKEGHIYFMDIEQVFDTGSWISMPFSLPHRTKQENSDLLTWLFPPKLVLAIHVYLTIVSSSDDMVPNGKEIVRDNEVPYEPKDFITTTLHLVRSCGGELLLVRHRYQSPSLLTCRPYTRNVELFKADVDAGNWIPVTADGLAQGEALFLSRSFSNSTRGYGDTHEGFVHFVEVDDAFDTRSWTRRQFSLPRERNLVDDDLLTWLFPPQVVL
ncbi:hypothetical protein EJB05_10287, partial [Eragrostis curvula]